MRIWLFNHYLYIYKRKMAKRQGVCSQKYDDKEKHALLWDFDKTPLSTVITELKTAQIKYKLPTIYIIQSSTKNYHAYCFCARQLREIVHILSSTPHIDMTYLFLGLARKYFTLRFSRRENEKLELVQVLKSSIPDEMSPFDITVNQYYSTNLGGKANAKG